MKKLKYSPFYIVSILPLPVLYLISDLLFVVIFHLVKYRRKVVRQNLIDSFPEKNSGEINQIEKGFYKHLCDVTMESIKVLTISKKSVLKRVRFTNIDFVESFQKQNRSLIMYTAHIGNWEWLSFTPFSLGIRVTTLYKPLSNKYFDELMRIVRSRHGVECIEANKGYKFILTANRQGVISFDCIVGDQRPAKNAAMHWTTFLNRDTPFSVGADRIAKKTDQVILYPYFKKIARGYYEVEYRLVEEYPKQSSGEEIINKYVRLLEENIKEYPEMYLWSHKRWKITRPVIRENQEAKTLA